MLFNEDVLFYQVKSFIIFMSEQPIELLFVRIKFLSKIQLFALRNSEQQHTLIGIISVDSSRVESLISYQSWLLDHDKST